jgi:hypothetical protein
MTTEVFPGCEGEYEDGVQIVLNPVIQQKIVSMYMRADYPIFASIGMEQLFGIGGTDEV